MKVMRTTQRYAVSRKVNKFERQTVTFGGSLPCIYTFCFQFDKEKVQK